MADPDEKRHFTPLGKGSLSRVMILPVNVPLFVIVTMYSLNMFTLDQRVGLYAEWGTCILDGGTCKQYGVHVNKHKLFVMHVALCFLLYHAAMP